MTLFMRTVCEQLALVKQVCIIAWSDVVPSTSSMAAHPYMNSVAAPMGPPTPLPQFLDHRSMSAQMCERDDCITRRKWLRAAVHVSGREETVFTLPHVRETRAEDNPQISGRLLYCIRPELVVPCPFSESFVQALSSYWVYRRWQL